MIILYIPFKEENDLLYGAQLMQAELQNNDEYVMIFQHGCQDVMEIPEDQPLQVYILGHGSEPYINFGQITSNAKFSNKTTVLSIEDIANRFDSNFAFFMAQVKSIELYFCNTLSTQDYIAERFKSQLINKEVNVNFYAGSLLANARQSIQANGQPVSLSEVRGRLDKESELAMENTERIASKLEHFSLFVASSPESRKKKVHLDKKNDRQKAILKRRQSF